MGNGIGDSTSTSTSTRTRTGTGNATAGPCIELLQVDAQRADRFATLLPAVCELFCEYRDALAAQDVDLAFQGFDAELAQLPGDYGAPAGALLLALVDGQPAGCGALRRLGDVDYPNACEMKRLYVRRAFRRFGLGRMLAQQLMDQATRAGYSTLLLDTLDDMEAARGLYASLGFEEIPPYYFNPVAGAHYLKANLDAPGSRW